MKFLFLISIISISAFAESLDSENWIHFKKTFNKSYEHPKEETNRYSIFQNNLRKIEEHNKKFVNGESTWEMGITRFADWTEAEFFKHGRGLAPKKRTLDYSDYNTDWGFCIRVHNVLEEDIKARTKLVDDDYDDNIVNFPESVDWRTKGYVLPPRDMGNREEHWAFSISGVLETRMAEQKGVFEYLSPQFIIDCGPQLGEDIPMYRASDVILHKGIPQEYRYPLIEGKGKCIYLNDTVCTSYSFVTPEETVGTIVRGYNPVAVDIDGGDLQHYKSGIIDGSNCNTGSKRKEWSGVVVGTGVENGIFYWIIKNSWGTSWGEEGYFRLIRKKEACGISSQAFSPDIADPF